KQRRGITICGQVATATLGYRKVVIRIRKSAGFGYPCRVGQPSQGLRRAPQKPYNSATRWPIPTETPRTKRHTPVHLLCVLKIRKGPVSSVDARELGCWRLFQVSALGMTDLLKDGSSYHGRPRPITTGSISVLRSCIM